MLFGEKYRYVFIDTDAAGSDGVRVSEPQSLFCTPTPVAEFEGLRSTTLPYLPPAPSRRRIRAAEPGPLPIMVIE